jgi:predicted nucleotidyltransferase component of viral defense system
MAFSEAYRKQVVLMLRLLPMVAEEECFALKGGTAINMFIRDMPRLSVDIDLTYLPVKSRKESLAEVDAAMVRIKERALKALPSLKISEAKAEGAIIKLNLTSEDAQVKVEVTPVLRGCVYAPELKTVSQAVEDAFGFAEMRVVSFGDLYAGKIVAALDRQHPRDLFDVRDLLANEGITPDLRRAFIVYLVSHGRPMFEVLTANRKDIAQEYERGFRGMTSDPVSLDELLKAREALIEEIVGRMPEPHRRFLVQFERGEPDWSLLGLSEAANLPAVRWRQQNLDSLTKERRAALVGQLEKVLAQP